MSELIHSIERSKQVVAFDGIKKGKVHPTDIDCLLEFDNKYLILFELKVKGNVAPLGQKLALQRIVDNWRKSKFGNDGWVIYAYHETEADDIIYLRDCKVFALYNVKESQIAEPVDMIRFLKYLAEKYNIEKLKL